MRSINRVTRVNPPFCRMRPPPLNSPWRLSPTIRSAPCAVVHTLKKQYGSTAVRCSSTASPPSLHVSLSLPPLPASLACSSGMRPFIKSPLWAGAGILKIEEGGGRRGGREDPLQGQHPQPQQGGTATDVPHEHAVKLHHHSLFGAVILETWAYLGWKTQLKYAKTQDCHAQIVHKNVTLTSASHNLNSYCQLVSYIDISIWLPTFFRVGFVKKAL